MTWEFITPFQAPPGATGTALLRLPGSSGQGAVRSVHEALAGGCRQRDLLRDLFAEPDPPVLRDLTTLLRAGMPASGPTGTGAG